MPRPPRPPDPPPQCDCPEGDGVIRHRRATCTDPIVAKLDWYAEAGRPEVKLAVDKRDAAAETAREAYRAWKDAEQRLEWAEAGLEVIVAADRQEWKP